VSLARVARDLGTSARTLQRQLGALSLSFQELLDGIRHERAIRYLVDTNDAVERIALRLGYGDASNFRRAFRRWTGATPVEFRAKGKVSEAAVCVAAELPSRER
jgi:AraC-like DNA-binding protein